MTRACGQTAADENLHKTAVYKVSLNRLIDKNHFNFDSVQKAEGNEHNR